MKIITAPVVKLIGRQTLLTTELTDWLEANGFTDAEWTPDAACSGGELLAEVSGRTCYMSFDKPRPGGNKGYLDRILDQAHGSVLEHAVYTFLISGVSRTLTHELVRHRVGVGYSQLSQRYVDESVAEYVIPQIIDADPELRALWSTSVLNSHAAYNVLCDKLNALLLTDANLSAMFLPPSATTTTTDRRKCARQAARSVLPNATETKLSFTANARALRHLFELRTGPGAEPEIRRLMWHIYRAAKKESPHLFSDYQEVSLPDGTTQLVTAYRKV